MKRNEKIKKAKIMKIFAISYETLHNSCKVACKFTTCVKLSPTKKMCKNVLIAIATFVLYTL